LTKSTQKIFSHPAIKNKQTDSCLLSKVEQRHGDPAQSFNAAFLLALLLRTSRGR